MHVSTKKMSSCHQRWSLESTITFRYEQYDTHTFQKEEAMMTQTTDECPRENASPWALCVCVSFPWANKLYEGKLRSTCPYCHALTHPHSHTFPLSIQHPILSKDEERAKPCMRQRLPIQIKTVNVFVFSLTKPWYVPQSHWGPLCASTFVVLCLSGVIIKMMMMVMMTAMAEA